ncbi:HIT family protein [Hyphomonas sp.]|jgi:histidine triad (HIT) family protein|uniref:HIT family protein n=1 Tax=Hyphomonas sp. TaxID=87 RepID=UPI0025BECB04|nr:HIT family protein [Hyphomonas sp.]
MTLHAPYDTNNIFAKILRGEMPSVKVFEDDVALAFMDVFPMGEGHTLVIPKRGGARHFIDLPEAEVGNYMIRVQKVARAVEKGLQPDGVRIFQFNGAPAGQSVFHLHFHVLPVWEGRTVGPHASGGMKSAAELEPVAAKIRAGL